ncbi:hypothetical protein GC088_05450 [Arthrobacter sp. JZ12]|uniref:hypothetical protein n=1 Tax=Arthrobacter sp. JZ12 TaxID=2654190 RepID=UPI002B46B9A3|nr:hypothetical protein [Arthrobacter sp. JZ12]WRH24573.1 hypothetical protein GC088_05450 [Arthrobacter sp. JZ12]
MAEPAQKPARVRVTAPQSSTRPAASYPVTRELAEHSDVGELFLRSLIRSQFRLAAVVASGFLVILVGIPVLFAVFPIINTWTIGTVPVPWLLLGLGIYPLVIACGVLYIRSANRNEQRFRDLVNEE